jgi:hypothetical protein
MTGQQLDPERDEQRLEQVQEAIDEGRERLQEERLERSDEPTFIDSGTVRNDMVDDAIAPPG